MEVFMTRERLESLTFESLTKVARLEGIEVPADVERILLIDLILEVMEDNKEDHEARNNNAIRLQQKKYDLSFSEELDSHSDIEEYVLPDKYNESRIVFMLRDPYWAFAYWDVKGGALRAAKKEYDADTALLRLLRLKNPPAPGKGGGHGILAAFDIPIGSNDSSWYVNLPEQDSIYCVELVVQGKNTETIIGRSNIIRVPHAVYLENLVVRDGTPMDSILALSGVEKLDVSGPAKSIPQRISSLNEDSFLHHVQ